MLGQPSDLEVIECAIRAINKAADYDGQMTGLQQAAIRRLKEWKQSSLQNTGRDKVKSKPSYLKVKP